MIDSDDIGPGLLRNFNRFVNWPGQTEDDGIKSLCVGGKFLICLAPFAYFGGSYPRGWAIILACGVVALVVAYIRRNTPSMRWRDKD